MATATAVKKPRAPRKANKLTADVSTPFTPAGLIDWNPQWEMMGGDCAALDSYTDRARVPFSSERPDYHNLPTLQPRGTLILRADPTQILNWAWFDNDGSRFVATVAYRTFMSKGYRAATNLEFALNPKLRGTITTDTTGRYVVPGLDGKTAAVVMVRDKASWLRDRREQLKFSDDIQLTAKERAALQTETLQRAGIDATVTATLEDSEQYVVDEQQR